MLIARTNLNTKRTMAQMTQTQTGRSLVITIAIGSLLLGLVGCSGGGSSDPTAQYADLKATEKPHSNVAKDQSTLPTTHVIEVEPNVTFVEGEEKTFWVKARLAIPGTTSFDVNLTNFSRATPGLAMVKSPIEPDKYVVTWTAPKGTVTSEDQVPVTFNVEITNVKAANPETESVYKAQLMVQSAQFTVRRSGKSPSIADGQTLPVSVAQGTVTPFQVEVIDPASSATNPPRLDIYFTGTNKSETNYQANGATYVRVVSTPKYDQKTGHWTFFYAFDTQNNDVGAQLDSKGNRVDATELSTRLTMKAVGVTNIGSTEKTITTKIVYKTPQVANPKPLVCPAPEAPKAAPKATKAATAKATGKTVAKTEVKK